MWQHLRARVPPQWPLDRPGHGAGLRRTPTPTPTAAASRDVPPLPRPPPGDRPPDRPQARGEVRQRRPAEAAGRPAGRRSTSTTTPRSGRCCGRWSPRRSSAARVGAEGPRPRRGRRGDVPRCSASTGRRRRPTGDRQRRQRRALAGRRARHAARSPGRAPTASRSTTQRLVLPVPDARRRWTCTSAQRRLVADVGHPLPQPPARGRRSSRSGSTCSSTTCPRSSCTGGRPPPCSRPAARRPASARASGSPATTALIQWELPAAADDLPRLPRLLPPVTAMTPIHEPCCPEFAAVSRRGLFTGAVALAGATTVFGSAVVTASAAAPTPAARRTGRAVAARRRRRALARRAARRPRLLRRRGRGSPSPPTSCWPRTASSACTPSWRRCSRCGTPASWPPCTRPGCRPPNRSHFAAMEEVEDADPGSAARVGWLNRLIGADADDSPLQGFNLAGGVPPTSLYGAQPPFLGRRRRSTTSDPRRRRVGPDGRDALAAQALGQPTRRPWPGRCARRSAPSPTSSRCATRPTSPHNGASYPDNDLGRALREAARVIRGRRRRRGDHRRPGRLGPPHRPRHA